MVGCTPPDALATRLVALSGLGTLYPMCTALGGLAVQLRDTRAQQLCCIGDGDC